MQAYVTNHAFKASWRANLMFGVPNLANLSAVSTAGLRLCGAECLHLDIGLAEDRISFSGITSKLSERPLKFDDQKTERSKTSNPEYNIDRDQPTSRASPLIVIRTD